MRRFEDEMVLHSRDFSPRLCEALGEEQLRVAIRLAMARAGRYGFTLRGPIRLYIEMTFLFGSAFDTDPQYPWAAKALRAPGEQMQRAEKLCDGIRDYQSKVSGPESANTRRALGELLDMTRKPLTLSAGNFAAGMRQEMHRVFPQKAAYIGEAALAAIIHEGSAEARTQHFPSPRGESLLVSLMFAFGHGCAGDPLYPWIERTLKGERITDPAARAERLESKAVIWLEHALSKPRKGEPT